MRYSGSKTRLRKYIIPIITKDLKHNQYYVEPFMGGCGILFDIDHPLKIGNDYNSYVTDMWKSFQKGKKPPKFITKELYLNIKTDYLNKTNIYKPQLIGYVGNACSYGGAWWNGYANFNPNKNNGKGENHILEAYNGTIKKIKAFKYLKNTIFLSESYDLIKYQPNSLIYCDPPYQGTKTYKDSFDNDKFWDWCRKMKNEGHTIYISEYNAPDDFNCVWSYNKKDGMGTTIKGKKQNFKIEKLFTL